jgi:hypothetical protein
MEFTLVNKIVSLIGKRNSGKSQMLRYLVLQQRPLFKKIFVICPTETVNHFYKDLVAKENIFDSYNEDWIDKLIKKMTELNSGKSDDDASHVLLILDDCCSDTNFHQSKTFKKLCTRGRHIKISVIITCQYIYQVPPVARNNSDFILCSQMNTQGLDLLTSEFLMGNISKKDFIEMYYRNTENFGFLIINNNCASSNDNLNEIYGNIKVPDKYIKK